tara:strand:+ start:287 stop:484 length:198 start_codon:yes stop_codon:yes gene_type:complete
MAQYKANNKYFDLGEKKDFRAKGSHSKHGLLVAGLPVTMNEIPKEFEGCFDELNKKIKKTKKENK